MWFNFFLWILFPLTDTMELSVDLAHEALKELRFLAVVNKHRELLEKGRILKLAIYR